MTIDFNRSTLEGVFSNPRDVVQFENLVRELTSAREAVTLLQSQLTEEGSVPTHDYYANHYSSLPTSVPFSGSGTVLSYTLLGTTRYRLIPSPYNPTEDAFYESFSDPTLSGLIVRLSLN